MVMTNGAPRLSERSVLKGCGTFLSGLKRRAMSLAKLHLTAIYSPLSSLNRYIEDYYSRLIDDMANCIIFENLISNNDTALHRLYLLDGR